MKKIIVLIILYVICTFALGAQNPKEPNTIYLVFQSTNNGIGLRYDRMIKSTYYGAYGSLTYGTMEIKNTNNTKHHYRLVTGVLLYSDPVFRIFYPYMGVGISYNEYRDQYIFTSSLPENELDRWSFELSFNFQIYNTNVGIRIDPMMKIGSLDMGFSF